MLDFVKPVESKRKRLYKRRPLETLLIETLNIRLTPPEKASFQAFCQANEVSPTEVLRQFIRTLVNG